MVTVLLTRLGFLEPLGVNATFTLTFTLRWCVSERRVALLMESVSVAAVALPIVRLALARPLPVTVTLPAPRPPTVTFSAIAVWLLAWIPSLHWVVAIVIAGVSTLPFWPISSPSAIWLLAP